MTFTANPITCDQATIGRRQLQLINIANALLAAAQHVDRMDAECDMLLKAMLGDATFLAGRCERNDPKVCSAVAGVEHGLPVTAPPGRAVHPSNVRRSA